MLRKCFSLVLVAAFCCASSGASALAKEKAKEVKPEHVEKIKRKVFARGTGTKARVGVKLNDGTKLKGYVSEATAADFTVVRTDAQSGATVKINYQDVRELKAHGKGMSTTSKVLIGAGIGVGVTVGVLAYMFRNFRLNIR
jgi:glucokinase